MGWCIVREELPETIFLDTRGKAIEVNGYACFFEKNESMLNFMLEMDEREKDVQDRRKAIRKMLLWITHGRMHHRRHRTDRLTGRRKQPLFRANTAAITAAFHWKTA